MNEDVTVPGGEKGSPAAAARADDDLPVEQVVTVLPDEGDRGDAPGGRHRWCGDGPGVHASARCWWGTSDRHLIRLISLLEKPRAPARLAGKKVQ
jgi:hypothetical protein